MKYPLKPLIANAQRLSKINITSVPYLNLKKKLIREINK